MCYVGKATKIFIFIVTVVVVIGLILGFGLFRHASEKNQKCSGYSCETPSTSTSTPPSQFTTPDPIPATTSTAAPPTSFNAPPSPVAISQGPVHA
ncbi:hypothetical protein AQUCO_00500423v1 [Aquilegia coerulea]|uniref:Uncharacterized protein n=1 Tax=Aquilegia coerulea TaxID=218851 RepID=A0A2G5ERV4_AQUCA|nr:hypothetical protein AQUCO_00500423v1 [Aquilegia coerulea]